jgi:type I restriction enzyme S subunit
MTEFLWFVLDIITASMLGQASGSTFPNLPGEKLGQVETSIPPISDQQRIVAILNGQMVVADRTRKALEDQLDTINKLPAALLRRAFNGEL